MRTGWRIGSGGWGLVGALCGVLAEAPRPLTARAWVEAEGPRVMAHRGYSARAPENTLPAFRLALAARADLVELDYHHTADGVPVVVHDRRLDRTTDAVARWGGRELAVRELSAARLAELDAGGWFAPVFAGTRLPTLREALETIQAGGVTLIERKAGDAGTLVRLLRAHGWLEQVVVQSFDWDFVRAARRLAPELVLGALGPPSIRGGRRLSEEEKVLSLEYVAEVRELGAQVVVWNRQVTAAAVATAHAAGLRVWVYTINDPAEAAALVALGVDGIITGDPAAIDRRLRPEPDEAPGPPPTRRIPTPLPERPGNIHLKGETVRVRLPEDLPAEADRWRVKDDRGREVRQGRLEPAERTAGAPLELGPLGVGWYRIEFDTPRQPATAWTTAAVLRRLAAPVPGDSPVGLDVAAAWFASRDRAGQERFANLAALAGVNWVRDRLRWRDLQPVPGPLVTGETTYDTAAAVQQAAGLKVLQVFHDTPPWARETPEAGGRFAPDLRHVFELARALAVRFRGRVAAWEPWNEANIAVFGGHTVDEMCAWQKAAWLGFKAGDPEVLVGWNVTAAVPTPEHTVGVLANETWPYFDTYHIHSYDWPHAYHELWAPARAAATGRPLWVTEADRGTPHLQQAPWFDQDPRLERLKAEWMAQAFAASLFAGARRHFHFILGHYVEPNGIQFGLLRRDATPRPAYVALAAVGRCLAGARVLGRWRPAGDVHVYAFRAWPDGRERDVLVAWAEREVDWAGRGECRVAWKPKEALEVEAVTDYLGRALPAAWPEELTSAPVFIFLPAGRALHLPLEPPPAPEPRRTGEAASVVLQLSLPRTATVRVQDRPWSEGYARAVRAGEGLELAVHVYNFGPAAVRGRVRVERAPAGWQVEVPAPDYTVEPGGRQTLRGWLEVPAGATTRDGWLVWRAEGQGGERPVLAFRVRVKD